MRSVRRSYAAWEAWGCAGGLPARSWLPFWLDITAYGGILPCVHPSHSLLDPADVRAVEARIRGVLPRHLGRFVRVVHSSDCPNFALVAGKGVLQWRLLTAESPRRLLQLVHAREAASLGALEAEVRAAAESARMVRRVHDLYR